MLKSINYNYYDSWSGSEGFNIEVYAAGLTNARSLRVGDNGTVFVSTRVLDRVYAVSEKDGKNEVKTLARGLNSPNGRLPQRYALYRRNQQDLENRQCRSAARQSAKADGYL